jgi:hypothetical protein
LRARIDPHGDAVVVPPEPECGDGSKLAGLWVDRAENINGNYAISDTPLSEQEWVEKHVKH